MINGSIQEKNGGLYAVLRIPTGEGKTKQKWVNSPPNPREKSVSGSTRYGFSTATSPTLKQWKPDSVTLSSNGTKKRRKTSQLPPTITILT